MMFCIIIDSSGPDTQVVSQGLSQNLRDGFSLGGMSQVFFLCLSCLIGHSCLNHVMLEDLGLSDDGCQFYFSGLFGWGFQVTRVTCCIRSPRLRYPGWILTPSHRDWRESSGRTSRESVKGVLIQLNQYLMYLAYLLNTFEYTLASNLHGRRYTEVYSSQKWQPTCCLWFHFTDVARGLWHGVHQSREPRWLYRRLHHPKLPDIFHSPITRDWLCLTGIKSVIVMKCH
jgi:hypothetical protein